MKLPSIFFAVALAITSVSVGVADAKQVRAGKPMQALGLKSNGGGTLPDFQCGPGYDPCDATFTQKCADKGGTLSGPQQWGGKTCFTPGGW
jgi:hypothetical protein